MHWNDFGVIFQTNNLTPWIQSHAYVPTAIELPDRIRVFAAFWDAKQHGRIGYIDCCKNQPQQPIGYSTRPIIHDTAPSAFDSHGMTPLSIIKEVDHVRLYYAGWHLNHNKQDRYTLYTGLLIGDNNCEDFKHYSENLLLGPRNSQETVRTMGHVLKAFDRYYAWVATSAGTTHDNGKVRPIYDLYVLQSPDGLNWSSQQKLALKHKKEEILGYGRSAIWLNSKHQFEGLFSVRKWNGSYSSLLYATSHDGTHWSELTDTGKAFTPSMTCDSQSEVAFPNIIRQKGRLLMFYNGNNFGKDGLRLAIL